MSGYHLTTITKGELGEFSKIQEEFEEALDAQNQRCELLVLMELSDMIGAINAYLRKHHRTILLGDLIHMSHVTERAFKSGNR